MSTAPQPHTLALCGAGMISGAHAAAARLAGIRVVAVASRTAERARTMAEGLGAATVEYADLPAGADIVVVATPPAQHAGDALRLLQAGAAVLLEKPLCRTLDEADRLVAAADANHGRLLYAENLAYAPLVQRLISLTPKVGPLTHVEVRSLQGLPGWGAFTTDEWGGGALFDLGVHPLAVAMLVCGAAGLGRPTAVAATLRGGEGHGSDEHAEVTLHYGGGHTATVVASWQAGPEPTWDVQVAGEHGVLRAELLPVQRLEYNGDEVALPTTASEVPVLEDLGYLPQLRAFVADLDAGRPPVMDGRFGREVLQVVMAAYTSAGRAGAPQPLPFTGPRDRTPLELWRAG